MHIADQPFRFNRGDGIIKNLDVVLNANLHHGLLLFLVHGESLHAPHLNAGDINKAAGPQAGDRGESGKERIGVVAEQGNMTEFHRHIPNAEEPENEKMPTVVSIVYFFICLPPPVTPKTGNFFLLRFCRIDDGIDIGNRLTLGNSGQDRKFDTPRRHCLPASCRRDVMNAPFLKILGKIVENALRFRQIRIGEYRNKFIAAAACGKAPYSAEVFIDIASQTPYGHLCRIMACARPDDIQIIQRKTATQ